MLATSTSHMILVSVRASGMSQPGTSVTISTGGFSQTVPTDDCGSAYFGGLSNGTYSISAAKTGYTTFNASNVSISGHVFYPISLD